ncbi:hypothetical protein [Streptomyces sp. NPDC087294]|uniref:hypothetical protein n=1 Tax=Streptomyces sp. NPDC087294 TaxID=3365777 RepID=UPI00382AD1D3
MSNAPVNPAEVPVFTGQLSVLDEKVKSLSGDGGALADAGSSVHTTFGGMSAYYQAPEAEQLFAVTKPVVDITLSFSSDMCTIGGALGTYANEIRPLVKQLETLKAEAESFQAKVADDEKWNEDGDLVDENLDRRNKIAEVWSQFQAAERHAHDTIVALVGGTPLKVDDGSHGDGMYGYDAEALKHSKSLPWGEAVEESVPWWQVWEHAYDFGKGFFVDGGWATIKGLGTLVGFDGWDAAGQAWMGLAKLATGLVITSVPGAGAAFWMADDEELPSWLRDSRTAMKETGKALVAWDQWGTNPSRAAGAVTFNVLTTVFTGGTGGAVSGAGKAGVVAKALSFASKAGRAIDPMTYVFKGAGAGLSKIGDVMAGLKDLGNFEIPKINEGAFSLPEGALKLPDGTVRLPEGSAVPDGAIKLGDGTIALPKGTITLPAGTVKLPFDDSPAKYMDPKGNLYKEDGSVYQRAENAPKVELRELASVGGRTGDDVIRVGSDISDPARTADNLPETRPGKIPGDDVGHHTPSNALDNTAQGSHSNTPARGGQADAPSHAGHTDGPARGGGSHANGTGGHHNESSSGRSSNHPGVPGRNGLDDAAHAGNDGSRGKVDSDHDSNPATEHGATDHDGNNSHEAPDSPTEQAGHSADPHQHGHSNLDTQHTPRELPPGRAERTLREMRAMRHGRDRYKGAEDFLREMMGGSPERHYPVPTHDHPYYPVETPGGRHVDVPVDLPDGRTLAMEVKHYLEWRTITLKDGSTRVVKGEVPLSSGLIQQINKDLALRRMDPNFDPRWVFLHAPPSQALRNYLIQARIIFVEYGPAPKK